MKNRLLKGLIGVSTCAILLTGCSGLNLPESEKTLHIASESVQNEVESLVQTFGEDNKFADLHTLATEASAAISQAEDQIATLQYEAESQNISNLVEEQLAEMSRLSAKIEEVANNARMYDEMSEEELAQAEGLLREARGLIKGYINRLDQGVVQLKELNRQLRETNE